MPRKVFAVRIRRSVRFTIGFLSFSLLLCGACGDSSLREASERAAAALERGRPEETIRILKPFGARVQESPTVLVNLGRAYLGTGDVEKGLLELRHAGTLVKGDDPMLLLLARVFLAYGEIEEADRMLEQCGPTLREQAEYHLILGHLLLDIDSDPGAVMDEFQQALRLDPRSREARESLLAVMRETTDHTVVRGALAQLPEHIARTPEAQLLTAEVLIRAGEWKEAAKIAGQLARTRRGQVRAWVLLGRAQAGLGQIQAAQASFQTALHQSGNDPTVALEYARFLMEHERISDALGQLTAAEAKQAQLPPGERSPALHNLMAAIYVRRGELPQAEQQLISSLALEPNQPEIQDLLNGVREMQKTQPGSGESGREQPGETTPAGP